MWLKGFPHGSFANEATKKRITITMPYTSLVTLVFEDLTGMTREKAESEGAIQKLKTQSNAIGRKLALVNKFIRLTFRLRQMAILATQGMKPLQYKNAEDWLSKDKSPYAAGPAHTNPHKIGDLIRCPDASKINKLETGDFWEISARVETVEKYIEAIDPLLVKEQNNLKLATEAYEKNEAYIRNLFHDGGSGETSEETSEATQPRVDTAGDVRMFKVKQPWADLLVKGIKRIENRSYPIVSPEKADQYPIWLIIVSSKSKVTGCGRGQASTDQRSWNRP